MTSLSKPGQTFLVELPASGVGQGWLVSLQLGPCDHLADATQLSL